jgi:hypothetical protein
MSPVHQGSRQLIDGQGDIGVGLEFTACGGGLQDRSKPRRAKSVEGFFEGGECGGSTRRLGLNLISPSTKAGEEPFTLRDGQLLHCSHQRRGTTRDELLNVGAPRAPQRHQRATAISRVGVAFHASGVIEVGDQLASVRQTEAQLSRQLPHCDRSRVQQPSQHGTVSVTQPSGIEDRT